jgi:NADH:ubiquinone oxidoreductase subunit 4 (subunit M)
MLRADGGVDALHAGVLMKLGAYGVRAAGDGSAAGSDRGLGVAVGSIACINIVYGALSANGADRPEVRDRLLVGVHMGVVMLGRRR